MKDSDSGLKRDLQVAWRFLSLTNYISKSYIPLVAISAIFKAVAPFVNIVMPKFILNELMGPQRVERFVVLVGTLWLLATAYSIL